MSLTIPKTSLRRLDQLKRTRSLGLGLAVSTVFWASSSLALAVAGPQTRLQFTQVIEDRPTPVVDTGIHVVPCAPINGTCRDLLKDLTAAFSGPKVWTDASISQALGKAEAQLVVRKGHRLIRSDAAGSARLACPTANCLVFAASSAAGRTVVWSFLQPQGRSRELLPSDGISLQSAAPAADLDARERRWIAASALATPVLLALLLVVVLRERRQMRRRSAELLSTLRSEAKFEIATLNVAVEAIHRILGLIEPGGAPGGVPGPAGPLPHTEPAAEVADQLESDRFESDQQPADQRQAELAAVVAPQPPADSPAAADQELSSLKELEQAAMEARSLRLALDQSAALLQQALAGQPQAEQVAGRLEIAIEEATALLPSLENRLLELRAAGRSDPPPPDVIEPIPAAPAEGLPACDPPRSNQADDSKGTRLGQVLPIASPQPISRTDPPPS